MFRDRVCGWALALSRLLLLLSNKMRSMAETVGGLTPEAADVSVDGLEEIVSPAVARLVREFAAEQRTTPRAIVSEAINAYLGIA